MTDENSQDTTEAVDETTTTTTPEAESDEEAFSFVEDPTFDINYKGDCAYEVKVSIPSSNEDKQAKEFFDELSEEAELPGFRKGRAPRRLLEKKFAKHVKREVQGKLVSAAFEKLVKDEKLRPLGELDIDGLDEEDTRAEGEPLAFTLKFEVGPRVELGTYRGVEIERPVLKVDDKDVEEAIGNMRSRFAVFETIEDGKAQDGDQVVIDFHGVIDGEDFPGGKAENYPYILGSKRFFENFEQVLTGSSTGAELSCDVTFPDDYGNQALRGKTATFSINVKEIKRRQVPELNDEFAQQAGYENVDDLRQKVAAQLREQAVAQSDQIASQRILDKITAESTFEFPKSLLNRMTEESFENEVTRLRRLRVPEAEIREQEAAIRERVSTRTMDGIKSILVLNEIADAEGIEVTDEDFEKEIAGLGDRYGVTADVISNMITQEGRRDAYEHRILRDKATTVLLTHAKITDKEVPLEELEREAAEGETSDES